MQFLKYRLDWAAFAAVGLGLTLALVTSAFGQGITPFSTHAPGLVSQVDVSTGAIFVDIPIRSKVGSIPFDYHLIGNMSVWGGQSGQVGAFSLGGELLSDLSFGSNIDYSHETSGCGTQVSGFVLFDSTGASHTFGGGPIIYGPNCPPGSETLVANDGSGISMQLTWATSLSFKAWSKSGINNCTTSQFGDPDGNCITLTSQLLNGEPNYIWTDSLGATAINAIVNGPLNGGGKPDTYSYTDLSAKSQTFTVNYTLYTFATNYTGLCSPTNAGPGNAYYPSSVVTPTGSYTFSYEQTPGYPSGTTTGRITKITIPDGGYVTYTYSGPNNGLYCSGNVPIAIPTLTETVYDNNGNSSTWTYVNDRDTSAAVVVTDPANNQTVYTFGSFGRQTQRTLYQGGCPTSISGCNGGGTQFEQVTTCYNRNFTNCATASSGSSVSQTDVYTSFNGGPSNLVETIFDVYGNETEIKQYDFGAAMPPSGNPISDTLIFYGQSWNSSSNSCNVYPSSVGINDTPCYSYTKNSTGTTIAQTQITYNNTGHRISTMKWTGGSSWLTSSATYNSNGTIATARDVGGAVSTYAYNGTDGCNNALPTSVTVTGSGLPTGGLSSSTQWNCNGGDVTQTTDANQQPISYSYNDPLWRVTSITDPVGNVVNNTYPTPNVFESAMNFNGTVSTSDVRATVDGLGRQIFAQQRQAQGSSTFDSTQITYGWQSSSGTCTRTPPFTIGTCSTRSMPYSGTAGQSAPNGTAVTTTLNDALERPLSTTDGGGGSVTYTYAQNDVLVTIGPASSGENVKKRQLEYDGLGRVSSVCEISAALPGVGTCGQNTPQTGYWTRYKYDALGNLVGVCQNTTQPLSVDCTLNPSSGQQTRTYGYDGLGRLTSETNPESGTTTYIYDSVAANYCTNSAAYSSNGDLVAEADANGNHICYYHDGLHRLTNIANNTQSNTNVCKRFRYDNASMGVTTQPAGSSILNPAARLVEAETDNCVAPITPITDEWFSYDVDGNVKDMWQMTPHSGQYYHSTANFYGNGTVSSLQLASPSLYTMTWGLEGEGRWDTLSAGSTPLVTGPTTSPGMYDAAGHPVSVKLTGTTPDQDSYTYDPNTGRMTQYVFTVGNTPSSMTGTLGWNANGTLKQLAITDGFNSGGTQTCNYNSQNAANTGYDDLGRLVGFDCGTGQWGQTFSFDPFGNLTKTKMSNRNGTTWSPGYNTANNECNGCTYDADGNVKGDGNNVYGWDVYSKLAWTAPSGTPSCGTSGKCITYDAFGRAVEQSNNSTFIERWITPIGETAYMSGATSNYAYWPAPGGGTVVILGTNNYDYFHKDWLGNARVTSGLSNHVAGTDQAYSPFGELYDIFGSGAAEFEMFAGLTGDFAPSTTTPVMWDTPNRELSMVGRWLSPDPAGMASVNPKNPQMWNRYAYVENNPLVAIDPTGLGAGCDPVLVLSNGVRTWQQPGSCMAHRPDSFNQDEFGQLFDGGCDEACQYDQRLYGVNNVQVGPSNIYSAATTSSIIGSAAVAPSGVTVLIYTSYWTPDCIVPYCIGTKVLNLFQFLDPAGNFGDVISGHISYEPNEALWQVQQRMQQQIRPGGRMFKYFFGQALQSQPTSCKSIDQAGDALKFVGFGAGLYKGIGMAIVYSGGTDLPFATEVAIGGLFTGSTGGLLNLAAKYHVGCTPP